MSYDGVELDGVDGSWEYTHGYWIDGVTHGVIRIR
jgi:hypothetical protein